MDIKARLEQINPEINSKELYEILDELGITYKKTNCKKCRRDLYNIALEEIGVIEDASEVSDFDKHYRYLPKRMLLWKRDGEYVKLSQKTPVDVIEQFLKETGSKGIFVLEK